MERIYINNDVKSVAKRFAEEVKNQYRKSVIDKLKVMLANKECTQVSEYLQSIIDNYDNLLDYQIVSNALPAIDGITIPAQKDLSIKILWTNTKGKQESTEIYKIIVDCMQYDAIKDIYVKYISELHIRSCVYCNANYAVTRVEGKVKKAQFEIDHFFPKSKYPHLCTSFFNFQPCCGCCNKFKSSSYAVFNLYTLQNEPDIVNPFTFKITEKGVVLTSLDFDKNNIEIEFNDKNRTPLIGKGIKKVKTHDEMFHITELYNSAFKEELNELIDKHRISENELRSFAPDLFTNNKIDVMEIIYGYYAHKQSVHTRPLTKLLQDVHQQLNELYQEK